MAKFLAKFGLSLLVQLAQKKPSMQVASKPCLALLAFAALCE
jgi:hypothetical protein